MTLHICPEAEEPSGRDGLGRWSLQSSIPGFLRGGIYSEFFEGPVCLGPSPTGNGSHVSCRLRAEVGRGRGVECISSSLGFLWRKRRQRRVLLASWLEPRKLNERPSIVCFVITLSMQRLKEAQCREEHSVL